MTVYLFHQQVIYFVITCFNGINVPLHIALNFAKSILCENNSACNNCFGCKQFDSNSHPDLTIINQDSIKVEDVSDEFKCFIGKDIRLDQVSLRKEDSVNAMLAFYMGKNTPKRQDFIIDNLVMEEDIPED